MCFLVRFKKEGRIYTQRFYAMDEKNNDKMSDNLNI